MAFTCDVIDVGAMRTFVAFVPTGLALDDLRVARMFSQFENFFAWGGFDLVRGLVVMQQEFLSVDDRLSKLVVGQVPQRYSGVIGKVNRRRRLFR
jgi:hypothetical protein